MKIIHYILILGIVVTLAACEGNTEKKLDPDVVKNFNSAEFLERRLNGPWIEFENTEHDFGNVIAGEMVKYNFKFTNTGKEDLILSKVSSSCGCTVPSYTTEAVEPGEKGEIEVVFNTQGRKGFQKKTITVLSNATQNKTLLSIRANVYEPEKK